MLGSSQPNQKNCLTTLYKQHFDSIPHSKDMYFPSIFNNLPMKNHLIFFVFSLHLIMFFNVIKAQAPPNQYDSQDVVSNFQPSLAVVIGILSVMFSLTFILVLYAKFCHRSASSSPVHNQLQIQDGLLRSRSRSSGIDKTVIESLPFFRFSSLKGSREGLECAICLSKFEDIEILRLLPKCKHAFHINCLDQWLDKHSSCPLCRNKVSADDDLTTFTYSNSLRLFWNSHSEMREESSNVEFYIQREESHRGSSRFSITSSFRKTNMNEEELPIQQSSDHEDDKEGLHKLNHRIIVSDVVLKNRWSNVSSSDLMLLNSKMIHQISSNRFSDLEDPSSTPTKLIGDEFYQTPSVHPNSSSKTTKGFSENSKKVINQSDKRSMSEIIVHPRFQEFKNISNNREEHNSLPQENVAKEERIRRIWLPIARRTVQWFANRERRSSSDESQNTRHPSNV